MIFENYFLPLRISQLTESMFLSRIFGKYSVTSRDSCDPHLEYIGQIKVSDGSLQDCNKALHHYDKMLVEAKFLSRPGKFNETEFVKFWYNCHTIFNSYDLSKSCHLHKLQKICLYPDPFLHFFFITAAKIFCESNIIFLSKQWTCYGARIQNESKRIIGDQKRE